MFKHNLYLLAIAILAFIIAGLMSCNSQSNTDRHFGSDTSKLQPRDYQLDVYEDSTVIWDGDRHVSTLKFNEKQALDSVIMDDNQ